MKEATFEDPSYVGPGLWFHMHKSAFDADTEEKRSFCIATIKKIVSELPCSECRRHAQNYLAENSVDKVSDLFAWTVTFHNTVNKRLGKEHMSLPTAKLLYKSDILCEKTCGAAALRSAMQNSSRKTEK